MEASHSEKRLIRKLVRSTRMCAASLTTARLPAICPPVGSTWPCHGSGHILESTGSNMGSRKYFILTDQTHDSKLFINCFILYLIHAEKGTN